MVRLPTPVPTAAAAWGLAEYRQEVVESKPAAGGRAQAALGPVEPGEVWEVDRITVRCTSTADTTCLLYDTEEDAGNTIEGTVSGNFDVADEASPVRLLELRGLLLVWEGADDGAIGTARIQYRVLRKG